MCFGFGLQMYIQLKLLGKQSTTDANGTLKVVYRMPVSSRLTLGIPRGISVGFKDGEELAEVKVGLKASFHENLFDHYSRGYILKNDSKITQKGKREVDTCGAEDPDPISASVYVVCDHSVLM
jgi:hypothetical protein